jgi:hypothetical protein
LFKKTNQGDEHFTDLPDPDDKEIEIKKKVPILKEQKAKQSQSSWVHMSNVKSINEIIHFFFKVKGHVF